MSVLAEKLNCPRNQILDALAGGLRRYPEFKVSGFVISPLTILMVDRLSLRERPSEHFSHHSHVLPNIPVRSRVRMLRDSRQNIAIRIQRVTSPSQRSLREKRIAVLLPPHVVLAAETMSHRLPSARVNRTLRRPRRVRVERVSVVSEPLVMQVAQAATSKAGCATVDSAPLHWGDRRSASARRNRYTMCWLRLRSSSLAHSVSAACRSDGTRRMKRATASAMSTGYTTLTLPPYYDTISISYRYSDSAYRGGEL